MRLSSSPPKLLSSTISNSITIKLQLKSGHTSSMTFIHSPETKGSQEYWDVVVRSDLESWSYGWSRKGMGNKTIFEFMTDDMVDYFARKFQYSVKKVFDVDGTLTNIKESLKQQYKEKVFNKKHYTLLLEQLDDLRSEDSEESFLFTLSEEHKELLKALNEEPYLYTSYKIPDNVSYFFKHIFPMFFPLIKNIRNSI